MLKLIKLELEGFGCFKDKKEFLYESGVNLVLAENGKGKTTQIEAILILLLSDYDGSFADYMNRDCDTFTISLEFMLDNKHLLETLTCKKGKTYTTTRNLKDVDTDTDLANGEGVKEWLNERLPVSTSKYALFVRQNSDMDIIHCSDSERRDLFKKIQDLDYTKEIKTLIEPKIEQTKEKIIENDKEIFALENKKYETKTLNNLPFDENTYTLKKAKLENLIVEKSLIEEKKNQLNDLKERKNKLESELKIINSSINNKYDKINEYATFDSLSENKKIEELYKDKKIECENKIKLLEDSKNKLDFDLKEKSSSIDSEIINIEKEENEINNQISSIRLMKLIKFDESSLDSAKQKLVELKKNLEYVENEINQNEKNLDIIKSGRCPYRLKNES